MTKEDKKKYQTALRVQKFREKKTPVPEEQNRRHVPVLFDLAEYKKGQATLFCLQVGFFKVPMGFFVTLREVLLPRFNKMCVTVTTRANNESVM